MLHTRLFWEKLSAKLLTGQACRGGGGRQAWGWGGGGAGGACCMGVGGWAGVDKAGKCVGGGAGRQAGMGVGGRGVMQERVCVCVWGGGGPGLKRRCMGVHG